MNLTLFARPTECLKNLCNRNPHVDARLHICNHLKLKQESSVKSFWNRSWWRWCCEQSPGSDVRAKTCSFHLEKFQWSSKEQKVSHLECMTTFLIDDACYSQAGRENSSGYGYVQVRLFLSFPSELNFSICFASFSTIDFRQKLFWREIHFMLRRLEN